MAELVEVGSEQLSHEPVGVLFERVMQRRLIRVGPILGGVRIAAIARLGTR